MLTSPLIGPTGRPWVTTPPVLGGQFINDREVVAAGNGLQRGGKAVVAERRRIGSRLPLKFRQLVAADVMGDLITEYFARSSIAPVTGAAKTQAGSGSHE